ncbi:MAG TPA: hypothetical protein VF265_10145 [Nevskiaceae bacterium]
MSGNGTPPDPVAGGSHCAEPTPRALFVLGASDPEMHAIERLLTEVHAPFMHAMVGGKRVYPANAYRARLPLQADSLRLCGTRIYLVECVDPAPPGVRRIDHHRPGDPGYAHPPVTYWQASSIGQTVAVLREEGLATIAITPEMRMTAAADHCLGAAYRGDCPGVEPDALLRWHVASRAAFERRSAEDVLADIAATQRTLRQAPRVMLNDDCKTADVRHARVPELLLAAASAGQCCLSAVVARDGRTKIGCLVGSPAQIAAFMQEWAPAHGLVDVYGDPLRGFAGAYVPRQAAGRGAAQLTAARET